MWIQNGRENMKTQADNSYEKENVIKKNKKILEDEADNFFHINILVNDVISELQEYWKGDSNTYKRICDIGEEVYSYQQKIYSEIRIRDEENERQLLEIAIKKKECEKRYTQTTDDTEE